MFNVTFFSLQVTNPPIDPIRENIVMSLVREFYLFTLLPFVKVSVYPKFDDFSKKLFFTFSDRSYCNLSFKKNSMKKG